MGRPLLTLAAGALQPAQARHHRDLDKAKPIRISLRRDRTALDRLTPPADPELGRFDLARLGAALKPERDLNFQYLGLQTLYDRYFLHTRGKRFELPQAFFMRVAMGLAVREIDREARAIEFYDLLSSFDFMASTPTLFNSGTTRPHA